MADYKGFTGDVYKVIANSGNSGAVNNIVNGPLINNQSPLAEAQRQADLRAQTKQKRPLVFEYPYLNSSGTVAWKSIELYINPERLSMGTQKVKSKQIARGGIFYHHWGDDHYSMQLSGTTGLSGMEGIEQLEEIYHASGTLLQYSKFGPEKVQLSNVKQFEIIDLEDPLGSISTIKENIGSTKMEQLKIKMQERIDREKKIPEVYWDKVKVDPKQMGRLRILKPIQLYFDVPNKMVNAAVKMTNPPTVWKVYGYKLHKIFGWVWDVGGGWFIKNIKTHVRYEAMPAKIKTDIANYKAKMQRASDRSTAITANQSKILETTINMYLAGMYNIQMADRIAQAGSELYVWEEDYKKKNKVRPSNQAFYQQALSEFNKYCNGLSSELKIQLAYQHTQTTYGYVPDDVKSFSSSNSTNVNLTNDPYRIADFEGTTFLDTGYNDTYVDPTTKLVKGQTGLVKVLKPINIYKGIPGSPRLTFHRQANAGESLRTFGYRSTNGGQYDLGNNLYIYDKHGYIRFEKVQPTSTYPEIPTDDVGVKTSSLSIQRAEAIKRQITALEEFYKNEASIREQLRSSALGMISTLQDKWLPRSVICYFENRAYVGTFDSFNYSRVANTPLINYELRFTVTKQIVGEIGS